MNKSEDTPKTPLESVNGKRSLLNDGEYVPTAAIVAKLKSN